MSESMVSFIENHRASLQGMAVDQENFGNDLRRTQPPGQVPGGLVGQSFSNPGIAVNPGAPPFSRPPSEHQPSLQAGPIIPRPTREQMNVAQLNINRLKSDYTARLIPMMPPVEVPPTNRAEYSSLLEIVLRLANDLDNKLPVFSIVSKNEENTRKLLSAIVTVQHQRTLVASPNPKFIVSFETLRLFYSQLTNAGRQIHGVIQTILKGDHPPPGPPGDPHAVGPVPPHLPHSNPPQIPPQVNPHVPPTLGKPPLNNTKKPVSTPTPPASAATTTWD